MEIKSILDNDLYKFSMGYAYMKMYPDAEGTFRYWAFISDDTKINDIYNDKGGEENEVANVAWIPIKELDNYKWAFGHKQIILDFWKGWEAIYNKNYGHNE